LDIFPTLGDLAGISAPDGSEGRSLAAVLQGKASAAQRDCLLTAYTGVQRAIREDRWKLIAYPQINKVQLFDLQSDPSELVDLTKDPAYAKESARLLALLQAEQTAAGDTLELTSEHPVAEAFDFTKIKPAPNARASE
jgi:arylsulfatase A-like enzyme